MKKFLFIFILLFGISVYAEGEATIKNIKVNGVECFCSSYECSVESSSKTAKITYELVDTDATVDRLSGFTVDLVAQENNSVKITVTNDKGEEKITNTYNINITLHEKSSNFNLKSLKINGDVVKLLDDVYVYSYDAKYSDEKIVIDAVADDQNAKVLTEKEYTFDLSRSSISIDFNVKAENGTTKEYRMVIKRGERPDTSLSSLKIDHGEINFNKDTLEYHFTVDYNVNDLIIEAVPNNDKASVKIVKDDLVVGENIIKIVVTNEKATSEYVLYVTREENLDKSLANLKSLTIKEYPNLTFEENVLDYTIKFKEIPQELTIEAISINDDGKIEILNNNNLTDGSKIIIQNTVNEGKIIREYTINILKDFEEKNSKTTIIISIILIAVTIIVLIILDIKEKKNKRRNKLNRIKELIKIKNLKKKTKKVDDDLEII